MWGTLPDAISFVASRKIELRLGDDVGSVTVPWWPSIECVEKELRDFLEEQPNGSAGLDEAAAAVAARLAADKHHIWQRIWRLHEFGRTATVGRDAHGGYLVQLV